MKDYSDISGVYFLGAGGIGMSALARYFIAAGHQVAGYDRTESSITLSLESAGCKMSYDDEPGTIPADFSDKSGKDKVLVVYTPAIPSDSRLLAWFRDEGYNIRKRSEILGEISKTTDTIAVSGTHGKTTVSAMTAHILASTPQGCSAFLGGISKNYNSNLILGKSRYTVMEADEYDRSFHRLEPLMALVTSVDADHLDIYGSREIMIEAYNEFFRNIRKGGCLIINSAIKDKVKVPDHVRAYTYAIERKADFSAMNISRNSDSYQFDLHLPGGCFKQVSFPFPGRINIENAVAASSLSILCGAGEDEIRKALLTFSGVERRFDIRINRPGITYIDDYAHHPEEIRACISSVREYFGGRHITGIFQPHLFSRTRDHTKGFAEILDQLDEVIILPVYPAREKPLEGVNSGLIYGQMKLKTRRLLNKNDIPGALDIEKLDVLLTIGAGDIDRLVKPIENAINMLRKC